MAPPRFREALDERVGIRLEEQHPQVDAAASELVELARQLGNGLAAALLDGHRDPRVTGIGEVVDELRQQFDRKTIDIVVAAVLEHVQSDALARSREPRNQY